MKKLTTLSFFAFLLLTACRKEKDVQNIANNTSGTSTAKVIADSAVNIINPTDKYITFGWVDTSHLGKAPGYKYIDSIRIAPNDTVKIPTSRFQGYFTCGYGYYSDDYTINNWYERYNHPYHRTAFAGNAGSKIVITINPNTSPYVTRLLGSWFTDTREWVAVDAYNTTGLSVWNTLGTADKNQKVITRFYGGIRFTGTCAGTPDSADFSYPALAAPPAFSVEMKSNMYTSSKITSFKLTDALPTTTPISTTALDTMFMTINGAPPYYKLYRKS